jgi:hypothetical protein
MTESEKLQNVSKEARNLFELATSERKYMPYKNEFSFFDDILDACFAYSKFDVVLKVLNEKTSLLNELLNVQAISTYKVIKESYNKLVFTITL